ncbi:MAG TPA: hypothetical protein VGQ00_02240 [Candidatus Norongarragalinales archaeon]|jgi:hypothetical protein|nr:hypothetical protein [Candidatus Norongarragalinales archaeon]
MQLGKLKARFVVNLTDMGSGSIELFDDGVQINIGRARTVPYNYIERVEKTGELPLGKVGVTLHFFDPFGNRERTEFAMRDNDFRALQNALRK